MYILKNQRTHEIVFKLEDLIENIKAGDTIEIRYGSDLCFLAIAGVLSHNDKPYDMILFDKLTYQPQPES